MIGNTLFLFLLASYTLVVIILSWCIFKLFDSDTKDYNVNISDSVIDHIVDRILERLHHG